MADTHGYKSSGELAQEVEAQRGRVEATIGQIQDKLSPGQLVDELLNYTKNGAGGEFVANLGRSVSTNPLPVALMGISLVWLMASQGSKPASQASDMSGEGLASSGSAGVGSIAEYRYATVQGGVRQLGRTTDDHGRDYSEFVDDGGRKYRALTGPDGRRAGDYLDEAGESFRGFKDAAGARVHDIRDASGNLYDAASEWVSDLWDKASDGVKGVADTLAGGADSVQQRATGAATKLGQQARQSGNTLLGTLHDQPLVGGALAFAVGAAIAASLPHTAKEDEVFGEAADALKAEAGEVASQVYEQGREQATEAYQKASEKAGEIYQQVKSGDRAPEVVPS